MLSERIKALIIISTLITGFLGANINTVEAQNISNTPTQNVINLDDTTNAYKIQLAIAASAVEKAEGSKLQSDLDSARFFVSTLNFPDKVALGGRLDTLQYIIESNKAYANKLEIVTAIVVKAEISQLQGDLNSARTLVNTLITSDKATLGARLDALQIIINKNASVQNTTTVNTSQQDTTQLAAVVDTITTSENGCSQSIIDYEKILANDLKINDSSNKATSDLPQTWTFKFEGEVNPSCINDSNIFMIDLDNMKKVNCTLSLDDNHSVSITPSSDLEKPGNYMILIREIKST